MDGPIRNWFAEPWVAPRYAAGRPSVHGPIAERIRERIAPGGSLGRALDVGCGTGLSARALERFSDQVVGLDPSAPMLLQARERGGPGWLRGRAEALPLAAASLDLVTIACAWHWCEQREFLDEAARVLRPGAFLAIYDSRFRGDHERPELLDWLLEEYWGHLAWVPRNPFFDPLLHEHPMLHVAADEELEVIVPMTRNDVKTLITSQASTAGNVEQGRFTLDEAEARLDAGLAPFWSDPGERRPMRFVSPLHFLENRT
jgi:SAM-dependent methyltransferase